ncbi:hypothetical protein GCM10025858_10540 [Alicyclobacillus sacchari]|uniref:hypothetical protein n=1 Tax=Alicyclobacillus sacchari TaxID=392010 RepID=UPI0023E94958|nr:hypothetical protein [Alicyclobacillus sacchari]GMA56551.1 hypothetical protein GCM10025858_10540 [Alicyclobacillus sacchari]
MLAFDDVLSELEEPFAAAEVETAVWSRNDTLYCGAALEDDEPELEELEEDPELLGARTVSRSCRRC